MPKFENSLSDLREMDDLSAGHSFVHDIHPLAKLSAVIAYIILTVSFNKYDLSGLSAMAIFPAILFALSGISVGTCFRKLRIVLPLVCLVGLFNPIFDRQILFRIGSLAVSGGIVSMLTLMMKGVFCLSASFLLAATTPIDSICAALRMIRVPDMIVTLFLLTFRYISVLTDEVSAMTCAYHLRAPGQKGIRFSAWGSFLGQLLLRSMDRADELYSSMLLRGFHGEFAYAPVRRASSRDLVFFLMAVIPAVVFRFVNIASLIGKIFV